MENNIELSNKAKDLWKQPGGTLAKVGLWVMGGSLIYGLFKALPYLILFTQNIFTLVLLMMGLGCVLYVAFSPEMRRILKLFQQFGLDHLSKLQEIAHHFQEF